MMNDFENLVQTFNTEVKQREALHKKLKELDRIIQVEFRDEEIKCHMRMDNGEVGIICPGPTEHAEKPDVRVILDSETLNSILNGSIDPLEAYSRDKIMIKGSFFDRLRLQMILMDEVL